MVIQMLGSASITRTSEIEITDDSKNDILNCSEKMNELENEKKLEAQGSSEEKPSPRSIAAGSVTENKLEKFALLYDKYNIQCSELERLKKANSELKEQLEKVRQEYDTCRSDFSVYREDSEHRIMDMELQLKMTTQHIETREKHYQQRIKQNDAEWDQKFVQLLKRTEAVEKEKNDAVCRYAAKEAQLMRLQKQIEELEAQKNMLSAEKNTLQKSTQFEYMQNMSHSLAEMERQLVLEKKAGKEREEQHKMTVKHLEASQTILTELRSRLESAQSQITTEQMEKEEYQDRLRKTQAMLKTTERRCAEEVDVANKKASSQEKQCYNACNELSSLRSQNSVLSERIDHLVQANAQLMEEHRQISQELEQVNQNHQIALKNLESLEGIQIQFNSSLHRAELAEIAARDAAAERDQAEAEAAKCRKETERLLDLNEQLTDKNSSLISQQEMLKCKNLELNQQVETLESSVSTYEKHIVELDRKLELLKVENSTEIGILQQQIGTKTAEEQKLNAVINELRNEQEILRKKNSNFLKDLRAEVQYLRKLQSRIPNLSPPNASVEDNLLFAVLPNGSVAKDNPSTSSQASSIASSSDIYSLTTSYSTTILVSRTAAHQKKSQQFVVSSSSDETNHVQQQMIEKIVKLQRQLARRQDKIDFLEEHVQQCTQELLKKTKIIQNYALREEAALLLPQSDLNKILHGPNGSCSTSSSLIGNLFASSANGGTGKSELKFVMDVNSRLQAVLEDALHKNITLTNNIDIMGKEISRLSRENRQLALSKTM
uniref:Coiled-coil domain-containing protein 186 n=1 Tax=Onchocerca volvulus TaxID=6282 RepID=A0A8R1XWH8_ONCVO